jgi:hypothetical protein
MARTAHAVSTLLFALLAGGPALAGVLNPEISIVGQPQGSWSDDPDDADRERIVFEPGEVEVVFDDYLNPYARAFFTLTLAEEGMELEEGFFTLLRGLPLDLALKGGQYRVPFGRLNPAHPHTYPFAEGFEVVSTYLPGEEAYIETGLELSRRFPVAGDFSMNAQVDWLQGNTFRIERESSTDPSDPLEQGGDDGIESTRPAFLGRLSGFTMLGDLSALEFGVSATGGTNNVDAGAVTTIYGVDAKAKLWTSPRAYLLLQAEGFRVDQETAGWDGGAYTVESVTPTGGYVYADYNFALRYNVGASYERFEEPIEETPWVQAFGAFVGFSLMEETTAFRLDWKHTEPEAGEAVNAVTLRAIFSMGPHKAHQF